MKIFSLRQSCRNYDGGREVEQSKLNAVLEAGILAPSAKNFQPWNFYVCRGNSTEKVRKHCQHGGANAFLDNCPVLIVVTLRQKPDSGERPLNVTKQDFRPFDAGMAVEQMCLEATDQGLSTCVIGWLDCTGIQQEIGTDEEVKVVLALGYAASDDVIRPKKRRSFEEVVKFLN